MIAVAPSLPIIYLSRFISALAICSTHPSMGVFVSEISHPDCRGSLGVIPSIFLALGITKVTIILISEYKCPGTDARVQISRYRCSGTDVQVQMFVYRCPDINVRGQMSGYRFPGADVWVQTYK